MNLKELTWEHHKNAERQEFVKELMSGNITPKRYGTFLFNQHPQYNILEATAMIYNLVDIRMAPRIHEDYGELWEEFQPNQPPLLPVVKEYMNHIMTIKDDPDKLMAHLYVRHLGDLSGGQIIAKKVPGSAKMYQFENKDQLKETIRARCTDAMADEAKICFDFATQQFKEMMALDADN